jgi:peptide/nickel transport system substrate-binding protein
MRNISRRSFIAIGATAAASAALFGCSSGSSSESTASGGTDAGTSSEMLTFGCQSYSNGVVDPANDTNGGWNAMRFGVGECLFKFDDEMNVQPWLAESCDVSDDHKTWTIKLKDGVKFSNGDDMTASAVVASIERLFKDGAGGSSTPEKFLDADAKLTPDDANNTVTIETQTAYVDLSKNLAYPVMLIANVEATTDYMNGIIGTGPYAIEAFTKDVGYTMKANEHYYEAVPFAGVEIMFLDDATAKANALRSGQIMLTENISTASDLNALKEDPAYTVNTTNGVRCGFTYMNQNGILKNDALRQAVLMAIDGQTICDVTVGGLYTYGFSVLPSNLDYNYDKLTNPFAYDPEKAKKVLDDAGITDTDGDGIRELDGEPIKLVWVTYENRGLSDLAQAGQQALAEVGIGVDLQIGDSDTQWNRLVNGDYDLNGNNWTTVGTGDPTDYLANWDGGNSANYCAYQNDEFDAAYEQLLTEYDEDRRRELITTMQQCLIDDAAVLVHGYYNSSMIADASKVGNAPIHTADYYWVTTEITPAA